MSGVGEMERESNQLEAGPILCRNGCGFFGSPNTDGLCSKCYKDNLKKKQQPPSTSSSSVSSAAVSTSAAASIITAASASSSGASCGAAVSIPSTTTAQSTIPSLSQIGLSGPDSDDKDCEGAGGDSVDVDTDSTQDKDAAKKKKNKCQTCKKKVGLTGFTCRCGGLFCSVHRYSNEHRCTFDYRNLGAEEIRRNNPVIKGEKIQKI